PEPHPIEPLEPKEYVQTIEEAKRAIYDGEIYQVNLSHRVALPLRGTPTAAYERLRARTPSTFGGFLEAGDHRLLSASPEPFPGGSITGAPKPRAMEIIERLEPHRRGVYTGAIGYVSWDRSVDWNIAIRTATVIGETAYFAVGGGIVADSDPEAEYRETLDK